MNLYAIEYKRVCDTKVATRKREDSWYAEDLGFTGHPGQWEGAFVRGPFPTEEEAIKAIMEHRSFHSPVGFRRLR